MKRKRLDIKTVLALFALVAAAGAVWLEQESRWNLSDLQIDDNLVFLDKKGRILRFVTDDTGHRHLYLPLSSIPNMVIHAFLSAEDERFFSHGGIDPVAVCRASIQNLKAGKIVSGASTITQQVSRMCYPRPRTILSKVVEMVRSLRMEWHLSKKQIFEIYLNRVPMGNKIQGVGLASRVYFQKDAARLTAEEAAVLASLPKAPGDLNPYGNNLSKLKTRRNWVLDRMTRLGYLTHSQAKTAQAADLKISPFAFPFHAPHMIDFLLENPDLLPKSGEVRLTLDLDIQKTVEQLLLAHRFRLKKMRASQASVVVLDTLSAKVIAAAGSLTYGPEDKGYNNGILARRCAGSTLKPFVYALALESGFTASHLLADTADIYQAPGGDYRPVNFNRARYGPVTIRTALGSSLNLPAVKMLQMVGPERLLDLLRRLDLARDSGLDADHYGLGLVLGNLDVSLLDLVAAYAALENGGIFKPVSWRMDLAETKTGVRIWDESTAHIIMDILSDPTARSLTFGTYDSMTYPFKVSLKTGTSSGYRDGWIVGCTPEYTVGVWAGNFNGSPTLGMSGATGAAPILKDILLRLYAGSQPAGTSPPKGVVKAPVCGISGQAPGPFCKNVTYELFKIGTVPKEQCTFHTHPDHGHSLPPVFAQWLFDRSHRDAKGAFQMAAFSDSDPVSAPIEPESSSIDSEREPEKKAGHHIIGKEFPFPASPLGAEEPLRITYPFPRDRFILPSPSQIQNQEKIRLRAQTNQKAAYVDWYVDGLHLARVSSPYSTFWPLTKGRHLITAVCPGHPGDSVEIFVE